MKSPTRSNPSVKNLRHLVVQVTSAKWVREFVVELTFSDGLLRQVDLRPELQNMSGVFERVKDPEFFKQVRVDSEAGTIVWPNGADSAPDVLYQM